MKISRREWIGVSAAVVGSTGLSGPLRAASWSGRVLPQKAGQVRPVVTALDYQVAHDRLVSAGDDHLVRVWRLSEGALLRRLEGHRDWVRTVAFVGDDTVVSAGNDRTARVWTLSEHSSAQPRVWFRASSPIVRLAVSPDRRWLALCCFSGEVHWFSLPEMKPSGRLAGEHRDLRCLAFSPDSRLLAFAGRDGTLRWIELATARQGERKVSRARRRDLVFLTRRTLLSVGDDGKACWVDVGDDAGLVHELRCERGRVFALAKLDERRIATAGSDNRIRIWNVEKREMEFELAGHEGTVSTMCWTGRELVSAGYDTTVRVWSTSRPVATRPSPDARR